MCNRIVDLKLINIKSNKSCGCLRKKKGENSTSWEGYKEISARYWGDIERQAKKRNLEFCITMKQAYNLFLEQSKKCKLSGIELGLGISSNKIGRTASLDRIDNNFGYIPSNIQWVHKNINEMRWNYDIEYFKDLCYLIINKKENLPNYEFKVYEKIAHNFKGYGNIGNAYIAGVIRHAKNREISFQLDIEALWNLYLKQNARCALTGMPLVLKRKQDVKSNASLDRIDSKKNYTPENIWWLHKDINQIKFDYTIDELKNTCKQIISYNKHFVNEYKLKDYYFNLKV